MANDVNEMSALLHEQLRGKISIQSKVPIKTKEDLSLAYTPGVAEPCRRIAANPGDAYKYTSKGNMVAVVTDGSAVLGLGDIGSLAGLPVMEGKAILFKEFGGVDAFPICIDTSGITDEAQIIDTIVETVKRIAPAFGAINLEDIKAPRCFEVEKRLKNELNIPVLHDDQHGTAIVVAAGLINASKVVGKKLEDLTVTINGVGAAGSAIARMLLKLGVKDIRLVDMKGIINKNNPDTMLNANHAELAQITNLKNQSGGLAEAAIGADVLIGVSKANLFTQDMIRTMTKDPIVFALANPNPEILPDEAKSAGVAVIATGRSDFPNQVNNVLAFPGIFKGILSAMANSFSDGIMMTAVKSLAGYIPEGQLNANNILPSPLDKNVAQVIANAVIKYEREQKLNLSKSTMNTNNKFEK